MKLKNHILKRILYALPAAALLAAVFVCGCDKLKPDEPSLSTQVPAEESSASAPVTLSPASTPEITVTAASADTESPAPTENTPAPTENTPAPTESTPAPTESMPAPTENTPAPTENTPVPTGVPEPSPTPEPEQTPEPSPTHGGNETPPYPIG